jgi:acetolactate synthase-1/3 small subunit
LNKLIDVVQITELHPDDSVERELLLATVSTAGKGSRGEIMELVQVFNGRVVDVGHDAVTVSVTSSPDTIDGFEDLVRPYGINALARTGRVALAKLEKQAPEAKILKNKKAG